MAEKLRKEAGPAHPGRGADAAAHPVFEEADRLSSSDLTGVKMRVPEIKTYLTLWETLGTRPSRLAWGEIFLGLKTGVVEAAEGPISVGLCRQVPRGGAKHVIRTDHLMSSAHITINEKAFTALPAGHAEAVTDCAVEAVQNTRKTAQAETEDVVRKMAAEGAKVTRDRQGADPGARQGRRGQDGEGRRLVQRPVGPDPEAVSRHAALAASACSTRIGTRRARPRHRADPVMVGAITVQVFTRYALGRPIAWVEESATYAFIWMAFVGASVGLKEGRHILIATFGAHLPPRLAAGLRVLVWAAGAADAGGAGGAGLEGDGRRRPLVDDLAADRAAAQLVLFAAADASPPCR